MDQELSISVRALVEYVFREGSIDNRFRSNTALQEGTAIHKAVQKEYNEGEEKEVPLEYVYAYEEIKLHIHGRCDGVLTTINGPKIDEIKSTALELEELTENSFPVYWAQAKGYAFIYAEQEGLDAIDVQLTYVQKQTKEKKRFVYTYTLAELKSFIQQTIEEYMSYARILLHIREQKQKTIPELTFPFSNYRSGQRQLAGSVYRTVQEQRTLFAQAPTGIGKTISTLFPAIKAMEQGKHERLFYLTAKTVTRSTAEEALRLMEETGLMLRSVTLTAKDKICFQEETICQPDYCEFADGYYDRINGAVVDVLINETQITRNVIEEYARKHRVCPFEFSLDLTDVVDVVIGDYNYIFDPRVSLKRLMPEQKKKTTLLIDEAHNLVERAREMYSAEINGGSYEEINRQYRGANNELVEAAASVMKDMNAVDERESAIEYQLDDIPGQLEENLERFINQAERQLRDQNEEEARDELLLECYFATQNFLKILGMVDEHYVYIGNSLNEHISIKLYCIDPSHVLQQASKAFRSNIFFSATLSPFGYYKDMLGGQDHDYILRLPSPYDPGQIDVSLVSLSTRFKNREQTANRLAELLYNQVKNQPGNHLFFFPSYKYMRLVYEHFQSYDLNAVSQEQGMTEERRDDFLAQFVEGGHLAGFAVLGGVFSEGVDLRGDRLNGVAVIGIGLAPRNFERELIKSYFSNRGRNGYDYAYVFPGMNKVLQAGGRLIRSEEDYGVIQLIDDRFLNNKYVNLLPEEWKNYKIIY
ncbi:ATP-dependent DNA helicase [Halobacillus ihumii]|uniref:ATP-dependent DNA helicase n=1 Tax=Halobacillus ihumii TaxID=2686092 RepID=UPI0013D2D748|nr:ATP-dependent DNA helicase [Halobacillus ihumii]